MKLLNKYENIESNTLILITTNFKIMDLKVSYLEYIIDNYDIIKYIFLLNNFL